MQKFLIGSEPKQKLIVVYEDTTIEIEFRFYPTSQSWCINITFRDEALINGKRVTIGVNLLDQLNVPFGLIAFDNQNLGIDPFKQDDFVSDRVSLYLLERSEVETLKGYDVP